MCPDTLSVAPAVRVCYNLLVGVRIIGLSPQDYWTDGIHLNTEGARKISRHLGNLLTESYGITDRRGDSAYASWNIFAKEVNDGYLEELAAEDKD